MHEFRYAVELEDDPDGGVVATFPEVPEAITFGKDRAEALQAAAEALGLALRGYLADERNLPSPTLSALPVVAPHIDDMLKITLVDTFRGSGLSAVALRDRLEIEDWEVAALLDPDHGSGIAEMENALAALGHRLRVAVEAA